jgi:hypothetical protein
MGRACFIKIFLKEIIHVFSYKSLGKKLHTLSLFENINLPKIFLRKYIIKGDNSSKKSQVQKRSISDHVPVI